MKAHWPGLGTALWLVLCILPLPGAVAREIHVAKTGDDAATGGQDTPVLTIGRAAEMAHPGDIVTIHAGTYREWVRPPRGGTDEDARIVFRAALGALFGEMAVRRFIPSILGFLLFGGFFLGPLVQKFAFDDWWTGWPFGTDWTDNKTLAALIAWLVAWWLCKKFPQIQRFAVLGATVVMVVVYLIPHSMGGSELDCQTMEIETGRAPGEEP